MLDPRTRLLFSGTEFFINGEATAVPAAARVMLRRLADSRRLSNPIDAPAEFWTVIHPWYLEGYVHCGEARA
jgi:50S ribosomal protein L16 3-hydroxylase